MFVAKWGWGRRIGFNYNLKRVTKAVSVAAVRVSDAFNDFPTRTGTEGRDREEEWGVEGYT